MQAILFDGDSKEIKMYIYFLLWWATDLTDYLHVNTKHKHTTNDLYPVPLNCLQIFEEVTHTR